MGNNKIHNPDVAVNVDLFHFAECEEINNTLVYSQPEHLIGMEEVSSSPSVSTGELYGDGKLRKKNSKKTAYDLGLNANAIELSIRRYMEGVQIQNGVESGTSKDKPKYFAVGWRVTKAEGGVQLIWFLYCIADPIEQSRKQSESNTNYSTDSLKIKALEHDSVGRFYTFIDSDDKDVTEEMIENFFTKVQTTDVIEKGVFDTETKE